MENPEFGPYIVEKLWRTFISDQPDPIEVKRLTALWRVNDFEIKPLLKALFLTDAFWDPTNRGRLVKSPIEMVAGTSRSLGLSLPNGTDYAWLLEDLGQMPFLPPNVGGWPEGVAWINDATASGRATILTYILYEAAEQAAQERSPQQPLTIETNAAPKQIVLYDVGHRGRNWRSLTMWMEHDDEGDATGLHIFTGDCDGGCLGSLSQDDDDPNWVSVELWDGWLDDHPQLNEEDLALLQSLGASLPDLVAAASDQLTFQYDPDDPTAEPADIAILTHAADVFRSSTIDEIGPHEGQLVRAFSRANPLGVSSYGMSMMNPDSALEAREEATVIPLTPSVTYETSRDWLNALPGTGLESEKAAAALLAVSRETQGQRDELIASDPDALIRSLILSPAYQVK